MSNTYRTESVFKGDVKFNKGEQDVKHRGPQVDHGF